jgi:hypothetical protein
MSLTFYSLFERTVEEGKRYYFKHGSAAVGSVNYSINVLSQVLKVD